LRAAGHRRWPRENAFGARRRTAILLVAAATVAWAATVERMRGMDAGPGTDLGRLGWYLGIWVTMTAAMMLPSAVPAAGHAARVARRNTTVLFVGGYLAVWTVYGLVAYGLYRLLSSLDTGWLAWDERGPWVAGAVIVAAGIYESTPLKRRGLRRCRSARHPESPVRSGLAHGRDCVTCSGGLMAVLFVLGVMSLFWMALVTVAIFAEKVLPYGARLATPLAVALVALGVWVGVSPASVPGLTQPSGGSPSMEMASSRSETASSGLAVRRLPPVVSRAWQTGLFAGARLTPRSDAARR
jgi:predicted metal-binding membrane protein